MIDALCLMRWDLRVNYPEEGRGDNCTSADATGFPIAPLLVNADAVAAALASSEYDFGHAIRFILPNSRIATDTEKGGAKGRLYVRPATHAGAPPGPKDTVPFRASDFQVIDTGARIVKHYRCVRTSPPSEAPATEAQIFADGFESR